MKESKLNRYYQRWLEWNDESVIEFLADYDIQFDDFLDHLNKILIPAYGEFNFNTAWRLEITRPFSGLTDIQINYL